MEWVVACMFKDERPLLKEWVEHCFEEGASHLYLIDNGSSDRPEEVLEEFAARVTLFKDAYRQPEGTQKTLLNKYVLPLVRPHVWVFVCDVDEYLYAQAGTVAACLEAATQNKVWVPWKVFGSSGHAEQPPSVVAGFTRRAPQVSQPFSRRGSHLGTGKMLARHVQELGVHEAVVQGPQGVHVLGALQLNHYMFMARDYYQNVKCARGGGETGHKTGKYSMAYYDAAEPGCNQVADTELLLKKGFK
jgi:hypothetical protein